MSGRFAVTQLQHPLVRLEPRPGLADIGEPLAVGRIRRLGVGPLVGLGQVLRLAALGGDGQISVLVDQAASWAGSAVKASSLPSGDQA